MQHHEAGAQSTLKSRVINAFPGLRTCKTDNSLHRRRQDIRLRSQHVAGWRFAYPAYKGCPRFGALFAPFVGPRLRSAAGLLLRLLLRLRQLADDRLAPCIPFRQPSQ